MPNPEMVALPAGSFLMGCERGQDNERPVHRVWLDGFAIGQFPVTNREYAFYAVHAGVGAAPFSSDPKFSHPDIPVVGITWDEAVAYCRWLAELTGKPFRLPTEAEWEYGARGGREGELYPWGNAAPSDRPLIGCDAMSGGPTRVGVNPPNDFGLYDMSEGVHEWCSDYYDADYYRCSPERNPAGPAQGTRKVSRGGSWRHQIKFARCAARSSLPPSFRYTDYGFRVALTLDRT